MIFKNAYLTLNAVDLSAYVQSIEPSFEIEMTDDTAMGDTARSSAPGLEANSISCTFLNPFAASGPDATIWPVRGTVFACAFKPVNTTIAATNPEYQFSATVTSWQPVAGAVGDEGVGSLELAITTVITRDTTP